MFGSANLEPLFVCQSKGLTASLSAAHEQTTVEFGNRRAFCRIEAVQ
jgi:hypothetical protein